MPLAYQVDSLEGIDNAFHSLYTENNGKFILTGVEGVKPLDEFNKVYGGLTKERNDHKATKEKLTGYSALGELADLQAKLDKLPELEAAAAGKIDETKINEMVNGRLNSIKAPLERQIAQFQKDIADRDTLLGQFKAEKTTRTIHDNLREALKKHEGFQASAFDDAAMLAERMFEVTEDGRVVTKDGVGVTPGVEVVVWLTEMQQKRPHWWGPSAGGGANGNRNGSGMTGANPFSAEGWNLTEQGKLIRENRPRAEQLAKAAGTVIGGARPAPRK